MAVRIGLAFNLKPDAPANAAAGATTDPSSPDEPDSRALRDDLPQPDLYAEWDEPATIDAVERALSTVGQVYRLEANASFPARLALIRPDFVFNIAEGLYGPNREGHVPAICEFLGIPCHASDPLTLGLALDKRLAESEYVAGPEYTIADMATAPWLRFPERQGVNIDDFPHLKKWRDKIAGRPAVKKAVEVLADRRRPTPSFSKEQAEVLFGATQYAKR